MKRFAICALSLMVMAGVASAQEATVWIQPPGGGNHIIVPQSQTAVIQVWMTVNSLPYAANEVANIQVILDAFGQGGGTIGANSSHFEVAGFNDQPAYGANGVFARVEPRGFVANPPAPGEALEGYQIVYFTDGLPNNAGDGVGPGTYLLDEIIIHGVTPTADLTTATADKVLNPKAPANAGGYLLYPGYTAFSSMTVAVGTGATTKSSENPLYVSVDIPEPASLSLLALGGLAAIRRRR